MRSGKFRGSEEEWERAVMIKLGDPEWIRSALLLPYKASLYNVPVPVLGGYLFTCDLGEAPSDMTTSIRDIGI